MGGLEKEMKARRNKKNSSTKELRQTERKEKSATDSQGCSQPTTRTRGEVLERGPLHAEVTVANDKHFVQDCSMVDEALENTGRMDVHQTPRAEDQRHLRRKVPELAPESDEIMTRTNVSGQVDISGRPPTS